MDEPAETCVACGQPGKFRCARCRAATYCSPACQKAHWKGGHKAECVAAAAETPSQSGPAPPTPAATEASTAAAAAPSGAVAPVPKHSDPTPPPAAPQAKEKLKCEHNPKKLF